MNSTVLVPLDGSKLAERALPIAEHLCRRLSARLLLIRCVQPPDPSTSAANVGHMASFAVARRYLESCASELAPRSCTGWTAQLAAQLGARVTLFQPVLPAALISLATRGPTDAEGVPLGAVATGVLRRAHIPIVAVRPHAIRRSTHVTEELDCDPPDPPTGLQPDPHELICV